jgi:hypothetical protein
MTYRAKQEHDAQRSNPQSPTAAPDKAGEIEHRKTGESHRQDVSPD